jgi:hypothetical protein
MESRLCADGFDHGGTGLGILLIRQDRFVVDYHDLREPFGSDSGAKCWPDIQTRPDEEESKRGPRATSSAT